MVLKFLPASATRRLSGRTSVLAVAAAIAIVGAGPVKADGVDRWKVIEADGGVEVKKPGGSWAALENGAVIARGSEVRTGAKAKLVLDSKGDSVTMSPNSRMRIPAGSTGTGAVNVKQSLGTLLFRIVKRPAGRFRVSTPYLAAVIKGTTFSVTVNNTGAALHVSTGAVQVTSLTSGRAVLVRPGQTAAVSSKPGTSLKLTGGKPKDKSSSQGAQNNGNGKSDAAPGQNKEAKRGPASPERAGKNVISKAIGGGRVDVFKATKGLVGAQKSNSGVGNGQSRATRYGHGADVKAGRTVGVPKSVKSALKSTNKAKSNARVAAAKASGNGNGIGKGKGKNK